jgi:hypothetical protein
LPFPNPAADALAAYRQGQMAQAQAFADQALAQNPYSGEALWVRAVTHLRAGETQPMLRAFRALLQVRSADWILAALRDDFKRAGNPVFSVEMGFALGNLLRNKLDGLGPILPSEHRRARHEFINLVGTSYTRGFGGSTAFFPLFIGTGKTILNLTDEAGALARAKFNANLKRVDPARNTVLILGGDAYCHISNMLGTRPSLSLETTEEDFAAMDQAAARHEAILSDAQKVIRGRVVLLGTTPAPYAAMNRLGRHLNTRLSALCERLGVTFLDWWDDLVDPETGILKAEYCANSMERDPHFSVATNPRFVQLLKREGLFSEDVAERCDFDWTHVFECEVENTERTRIWCEPTITPNNALKSAKIAASFLTGRLADLASLLLTTTPGSRVAMLNVRDGLLPVAIPPQLHAGCVAFTDTEDNRKAGQAVLDFYGRTDVQLECWTEATAAELQGESFDLVVVTLQRATMEADEKRLEGFLRSAVRKGPVLVMTPEPEQFGRIDLGGYKAGNSFAVSNKHLLPEWQDVRIIMLK